MSNPVKLGGQVQVTVEDGIPNCPACGVPMVEAEPGVWRCPAAPRPLSPLTEDHR